MDKGLELDLVEKAEEYSYQKAENEKQKEIIKEARNYIYSNWAGVENYVDDPNAEGCSSEGHVSHVLASRMSFRPLAWSEDGADRMARLRALNIMAEKKTIYTGYMNIKKNKKESNDFFNIYTHKLLLYNIKKI